ncbi:MAG: hypothetical protein HFE57_06005 [Firmicutes bacterium]|jgi:hypothetical protein|nr:hypothetical protein [Bacillota bacterium]
MGKVEKNLQEIKIVFHGASRFDVYIDGEKQKEMKSFKFEAEAGKLPTYTIERYTFQYLDDYAEHKV